jgi:hypothetical protein
MTDITTSDRTFTGPLDRVDECCYRIPKSYKPGMLVDGLIFADERLLSQLRSDRAPEQVANVAFLPPPSCDASRITTYQHRPLHFAQR